jgi:hypothetical protein
MVGRMVDESGKPLQKGSTGDGSLLFLSVLNEISYQDNEIWVAYITKADTPHKVDNRFEDYSVNDVDDSLHSFAKDIEMFVTVTSSSNALITSHMGIATSIEGVRTRQKGTSLDLHSFAAKVMLMRNPARKFMVNTPAFAMEQIIVNALPDATFVGTRQMRKEMEEVQRVNKEEFFNSKGNNFKNRVKEKVQKKAKEEAEKENSSLKRQITSWREGDMKDGSEKHLREKAIKYLSANSLIEMGTEGKFVISEEKIE